MTDGLDLDDIIESCKDAFSESKSISTTTTPTSSITPLYLTPSSLLSTPTTQIPTWSFEFLTDIALRFIPKAPWKYNAGARFCAWVENRLKRKQSSAAFPKMDIHVATEYRMRLPQWLSELDEILVKLSNANTSSDAICKLANVAASPRFQDRDDVKLISDSRERDVNFFLKDLPPVEMAQIGSFDFNFYCNHVQVSKEERMREDDFAQKYGKRYDCQVARAYADKTMPLWACGIILEECRDKRELISVSETRRAMAIASQVHGFRVRRGAHAIET